MFRVRLRKLILLISVAWAASGCSHDSGEASKTLERGSSQARQRPASSAPRPPVVISDSAGMTVAVLKELPALDDPRFRWELHRNWSVSTASSDPTSEPLFYDPQGLVPLGDTAVVVLDNGEFRLGILNPRTGGVLRRFGKAGQGPGEILDVHSLVATDGMGHIRVADRGNNRLDVFSVTGALSSSLALTGFGNARGIGVWHIDPPTEGIIAQVWSVADPSTNTLIDSLVTIDWQTGRGHALLALPPRPPRSPNSMNLFAPATRWAVLDGGDVVVGNTESASYHVLDPTGRLVREVRLPLSAHTLSRDEAAEVLKNFRGQTRSRVEVTAPLRYPIANMIYALGDTVFAMYQSSRSRAHEDPALPEGQTVWRLVSTSGQYVGTLWFPIRFLPMWTRGRTILGVQRDSLGVAALQSYSVAPPTGM